MNPNISIITPAYNAQEYISKAIQSVLNQTYQDFELIIIDDCSRDETWDLLQKIAAEDGRVKVFKNEKNLGPANTRNVGIKKAKGRFIAFLDSDDEWLPQKLTTQINFISQNNVSFCYSDYFIYKNGKRTLKKTPPSLTYFDLLKQNNIGCLTAIYDTQKLGKLYMPDLKKNDDFGLWLQILKKIPRAYGVQKPLAVYNLGENTISSNKIKMAYHFWKILRNFEKINYPSSVFYFLNYTVRSLQERFVRKFEAVSIGPSLSRIDQNIIGDILATNKNR